MTRHHARAARREREAASILKTTRVRRRRGERAPDVQPVALPCGVVLTVEVKTRKTIPAVLRKALAQARGYLPAPAVPCVVLSPTGGEALVCLPARVFAQIAGVQPLAVGAQGLLLFGDPSPARPGESAEES